MGGDDTPATPGDTSSLYLLTSKDYNVLASVAVLSLVMNASRISGGRMDKSTKPDFLREARLQDCLDFLDKLRKSGVTNMFDVRQTLRQAFPDLTTKQTAEVVAYWMHTFTTRAHKEAS